MVVRFVLACNLGNCKPTSRSILTFSFPHCRYKTPVYTSSHCTFLAIRLLFSASHYRRIFSWHFLWNITFYLSCFPEKNRGTCCSAYFNDKNHPGCFFYHFGSYFYSFQEFIGNHFLSYGSADCIHKCAGWHLRN